MEDVSAVVPDPVRIVQDHMHRLRCINGESIPISVRDWKGVILQILVPQPEPKMTVAGRPPLIALTVVQSVDPNTKASIAFTYQGNTYYVCSQTDCEQLVQVAGMSCTTCSESMDQDDQENQAWVEAMEEDGPLMEFGPAANEVQVVRKVSRIGTFGLAVVSSKFRYMQKRKESNVGRYPQQGRLGKHIWDVLKSWLGKSEDEVDEEDISNFKNYLKNSKPVFKIIDGSDGDVVDYNVEYDGKTNRLGIRKAGTYRGKSNFHLNPRLNFCVSSCCVWLFFRSNPTFCPYHTECITVHLAFVAENEVYVPNLFFESAHLHSALRKVQDEDDDITEKAIAQLKGRNYSSLLHRPNKFSRFKVCNSEQESVDMFAVFSFGTYLASLANASTSDGKLIMLNCRKISLPKLLEPSLVSYLKEQYGISLKVSKTEDIILPQSMISGLKSLQSLQPSLKVNNMTKNGDVYLKYDKKMVYVGETEHQYLATLHAADKDRVCRYEKLNGENPTVVIVDRKTPSKQKDGNSLDIEALLTAVFFVGSIFALKNPYTQSDFEVLNANFRVDPEIVPTLLDPFRCAFQTIFGHTITFILEKK